MSVEQYTKEELREMFLIEVAFEVLSSGKTPYSFHEIVAEVSRLLELSDDEVNEKMAQFYTDINIDGRFLSLGDNRWGLRTWYPVDKSEEEIVTVTKPKKKKAKKAKVEEFDDFDNIDDEEDFDDFEEDIDDDELLDEDDDDLEDDEDDLLDDDLSDEEEDDDFEEELDESYELEDEDLDEEEEEEDK